LILSLIMSFIDDCQNLANLPPEIWVRVFEDFPLQELGNAEKVSKGWRNFIRNSPPLWQRQLDRYRSSDHDPMIRDFAGRIPLDSSNGVMIKKAVLTLHVASGKIRKLGPRPVVPTQALAA